MKLRMVEQREGERLGDIDWAYDFVSHAWTADRGGHNPELIPKEVELLRQVEEAFKAGKSVKVRMYETLESVVDVGMYDGWPHWRPVPSFCSSSWLGSSWHDFTSLRDVVIE